MFERFTKKAREVVERSATIATESRASRVRPEHLLAALLGQPDCLAVEVLEGMGASRARIHSELDRRRSKYVDGLDDDDAAALASIGIDLEEVVSRLDTDAPRRRRRGRFGLAHVRFARSSKKALELSLREAISLGHNYIGTEHLLLGLVREGDAIVRDSLVAAGVDLDAVRPAVADAVRHAS